MFSPCDFSEEKHRACSLGLHWGKFLHLCNRSCVCPLAAGYGRLGLGNKVCVLGSLITALNAGRRGLHRYARSWELWSSHARCLIACDPVLESSQPAAALGVQTLIIFPILIQLARRWEVVVCSLVTCVVLNLSPGSHPGPAEHSVSDVKSSLDVSFRTRWCSAVFPLWWRCEELVVWRWSLEGTCQMVSRVSQPWLTKHPSQQDQKICWAFHTVLCFHKIEVPPPETQTSLRCTGNKYCFQSLLLA